MVDNVAITAGSGTSIATDDVAGVHYQVVKTAFGALDTATLTSTSNPFPVSLTNVEKAEDAAHSSGDKGVMALGVVTTSGAGTSVTDQDYAALTLNAVGGLRVTPVPDTVGGMSFVKNIDVDESEDAVKTSAGLLFGLILQNLHATTDRFVKIYNATVASVVVGTTVPDLTFKVEANSIEHITFGIYGIAFGTAITIAATTGLADNDSGAPGNNEVIATVLYK